MECINNLIVCIITHCAKVDFSGCLYASDACWNACRLIQIFKLHFRICWSHAPLSLSILLTTFWHLNAAWLHSDDHTYAQRQNTEGELLP